ncbi:glycosyltransferase family 4 protein [Clostridium perfringens]|nr:glycosyltransferase family 4 protein [Clostridium perfringens]
MNDNSKLKIYILHEYDTKSHFSALYNGEKNGEIIIKDYVILSKMFLIKKLFKDIINRKNIIRTISNFSKNIKKLLELKKIKNEIVIVGIAPYDKLLNKYENIFKKNKCIYFTSWTDWSGHNFPNGNIKNKLKYEKILKESFGGVACVTQKTEKSIKKYISNTEVVNHSIDTKLYAKKNTSNLLFRKRKRILYLGQIIERKNIDIILNWIERSEKDFEISFAGDGKLKNKVLDMCKVNKNVKYLGVLNKKEIQERLNTFDFLLLPSKDEPFGIVLIEALASGVPCIVSDADGPKEIICNGINGFTFENDNFQSFYDTMEEIFSIDFKDYKKMVENSIESSKNYDNDYILDKWRKLIYRTIGEKNEIKK